MQRDVLKESKRTKTARSVNQQQDADVVARQVMWRMIVITKLESAQTVEKMVIAKPYAKHRGKKEHGPIHQMVVSFLTTEPRRHPEEQSTHPEDPKCHPRGVLDTRLTHLMEVIIHRGDQDIPVTEPK